MNRRGNYEARHGIVWICGEPYTVAKAEEHAHAFLDMTLTANGSHWREGWGEQLNELVVTIREARRQAADEPAAVSAQPLSEAA
jgi:heme oxygenase